MSEQKAEYVVTLYDRVAHDNTWNDLGAGIADEIDRAMAMCAADSLAALQRAADLVTLADATDRYSVWLGRDENGVPHVQVEKNDEQEIDTPQVFCGPDAIADAAAWCRQRGGA
jgi:hypothetical protein